MSASTEIMVVIRVSLPSGLSSDRKAVTIGLLLVTEVIGRLGFLKTISMGTIFPLGMTPALDLKSLIAIPGLTLVHGSCLTLTSKSAAFG